MVKLVQKIWYSDSSTRVEIFEAATIDAARGLAYAALDHEIARQWEDGLVKVVRAICDESDLVESLA